MNKLRTKKGYKLTGKRYKSVKALLRDYPLKTATPVGRNKTATPVGGQHLRYATRHQQQSIPCPPPHARVVVWLLPGRGGVGAFFEVAYEIQSNQITYTRLRIRDSIACSAIAHYRAS